MSNEEVFLNLLSEKAELQYLLGKYPNSINATIWLRQLEKVSIKIKTQRKSARTILSELTRIANALEKLAEDSFL